jgi:DNA-directed RNA polymerase specialized sigma24 family protein
MVCALLRREDQPRDDAGPPPPERDTEELRRALRALPPRTRAALVLRLHDSLAEADTADVLGCSPGTVAALIEEATAALRGIGLGEPPAPAAAPSSPGAARTTSPEPDDDAIYRRPR